MKTENLQKVHCGNKLLTGEIGEQREQREDKDYKTHLARISSAGQGLCNCPEVGYCVQAFGGGGVELHYVKLSQVRLSRFRFSRN